MEQAVKTEPKTIPLEALPEPLRLAMSGVMAELGEEVLVTQDGVPLGRLFFEPAGVNPYAGKSFKWLLLNGPSFEGLDLERDRSPMREIDW